MSVSEQENGAQTLKKHSNVLVLEVGSLPTYTVATVRVLPFFRFHNVLCMMRVSMQCCVRMSVTAQELPLTSFLEFLELHRSEANLDSANDDK